jgi:hypothetical protein
MRAQQRKIVALDETGQLARRIGTGVDIDPVVVKIGFANGV